MINCIYPVSGPPQPLAQAVSLFGLCDYWNYGGLEWPGIPGFLSRQGEDASLFDIVPPRVFRQGPVEVPYVLLQTILALQHGYQ